MLLTIQYIVSHIKHCFISSIKCHNMHIQKQKQSLEIKNYDDVVHENSIRKHGCLFGGNCKRGLLIGPSGCGKTNVMISLLEHPNGLRYENVYLYCKTLQQPKYVYLKNVLKAVSGVGYFEFDDDNEIVKPSEIKFNSVIIFDDVASSKQDIMREYFCFGRHMNTDSFYLCQTYSSIPKRLIRDNANLIIIFRQDSTNLKHIYDDHVSVDMSLQQFIDLCSHCWNEKFGFVVIDKDCALSSGRYRKGFDNFFCF